jgi:small-conductance mechanosensitive channel
METDTMKMIYEWGIPSAAFLIWMILALFAVPALLKRLSRSANETQNASKRILASALETPLILLLIGLGLRYFLDAVPPLPVKLIKYTHALFIILLGLASYLFLDRLIMEILRRYGGRVNIIGSGSGVIKTLYRASILGFAFIIILDQLGITVTPFIASFGVGGLVVALALQDTLSNFFSGIYISIDKPIRIGDYIKLEAGEGYVSHVGWRSTRIRMLSNNILIIPNAKLLGSQITNFYLPDTEMAALVEVGVSYKSDLQKVERVTIQVAKEVLQEVEGGVKEFEPFIRYHTFGEFSIKFSVILRAKEFTDQYLLTHEFIKRLQRRYQSEGIEIPYPVQSIYIKNEPSKE